LLWKVNESQSLATYQHPKKGLLQKAQSTFKVLYLMPSSLSIGIKSAVALVTTAIRKRNKNTQKEECAFFTLKNEYHRTKQYHMAV
jgi:uncharacterized protein YoaH (UPF0181 family)